jgi:hypothetical protein
MPGSSGTFRARFGVGDGDGAGVGDEDGDGVRVRVGDRSRVTIQWLIEYVIFSSDFVALAPDA